MKRLIPIVVAAGALFVAASPVSANTGGQCSVDGISVNVEFKTVYQNVTRHYQVQLDGDVVADGVATFSAPGDTVSVDLPNYGYVQVYASKNGEDVLEPTGEAFFCGVNPVEVIAPVVVIPVPIVIPVTPSKPVKRRVVTPKPPKRVPTCRELKKKGAGRYWYIKLRVPYYECHTNPRPKTNVTG